VPDEAVVAFYGSIVVVTGFKAMCWGSWSARLTSLMLTVMWLATIDVIHGLEYLDRSQVDGYMDFFGASVMALLISTGPARWKLWVFWAFILQMVLSILRMTLPDEFAFRWCIAAARNMAFAVECVATWGGWAGRPASRKTSACDVMSS